MHLLVCRLLHFQVSLQNNFCIVWKTSLLLTTCLSRCDSCSSWPIIEGWLPRRLRSDAKHCRRTICSANYWSRSRRVIVRVVIELASISIDFLAVVWILTEALWHVFACNWPYGRYICSHMRPWPNTKTLLRVHSRSNWLFASITPSAISVALIGSIKRQLMRIEREMVNRLEPKTHIAEGRCLYRILLVWKHETLTCYFSLLSH